MWFAAFCVAATVWIGHRFWHRHIAPWEGDVANFNGHRFRVYVRSQRMRIGVDTTSRAALVLRRENEIDAFFRGMGLSKEHQTGDANFDRRIYVSTDDFALSKRLLDDVKTREIVDRLVWYDDYHLYAKKLVVRSGRIWVELTDHGGFDRKKTRPMLEKILPALTTFGSHLAVADDGSHRRSFRTLLAAALNVACWGLATAALVFICFLRFSDPFPLTEDNGALLGYATIVGLAVAVTLAMCSLLALRKTPYVHGVLASVLVGGGFGFSFFSSQMAYRMNIALDDARPQVHAVVIHAMESNPHHKEPTTYIVTLDDWRNPETTRTLEVDAADFHGFEVGDTVQVFEHPGALGYRWISRVRKPLLSLREQVLQQQRALESEGQGARRPP